MKKILAGIFSLCGCLYAIGGHAENICCAPEDQCGDVCCPNRGCNEAATACAEVDPCEAGLDGYGYDSYGNCGYCSYGSYAGYCLDQQTCGIITGFPSHSWDWQNNKCCQLEGSGYGQDYPSYLCAYCAYGVYDGYGYGGQEHLAGYCMTSEICSWMYPSGWGWNENRCCPLDGYGYGVDPNTGYCMYCDNGTDGYGYCITCAPDGQYYGYDADGNCAYCPDIGANSDDSGYYVMANGYCNTQSICQQFFSLGWYNNTCCPLSNHYDSTLDMTTPSGTPHNGWGYSRVFGECRECMMGPVNDNGTCWEPCYEGAPDYGLAGDGTCTYCPNQGAIGVSYDYDSISHGYYCVTEYWCENIKDMVWGNNQCCSEFGMTHWGDGHNYVDSNNPENLCRTEKVCNKWNVWVNGVCCYSYGKEIVDGQTFKDNATCNTQAVCVKAGGTWNGSTCTGHR